MSEYLVVFLLTSGSVTLCSHIYDEYVLINEPKTWDKARSYCREHYTDLATIGNHDDMEWLGNMITSNSGDIWIGLRETGPASWAWSVGETDMSHESPTYSNWASLNERDHYCGGMRADGKWLSGLCGTALPFVCREVEESGELLLVLQNMTWQKAQQYCRQQNMDLASARDQSENQALQQVFSKNGLPALVWIGLFKDKWKWTDQSNSSFRDWVIGQPNNDGDCTLFGIDGWYDRDCQYNFSFLCHNVIEPTVKRIVRLEIRSDSPLQFQDLAVSEAILIQIQEQIEGAKFRWIVQPDGEIFDKKQKKKVNDDSCYI